MKKNHKRLIPLLLAVLLLVSAMTGCGGNPPAQTTSPDSPQTSAPSQETQAPAQNDAWNGVITVVQSSDIIAWDPCASADVNTKNCLKNIVNRLFETDENLDPVPILVESWKQIDDLTWEFTLHKGVKFFDGNEMTADDVKSSIMRAREKSSSGKSLYGPIEEFTVKDDYNFTIKTAYIYNSLPTALSNTSGTILETEWVEKADNKEIEWDEVMRNGATGRYYLGKRVLGNSVELVANKNYWDFDNDGAKNESLLFKIIPEATTRTIMVQTGEADLNVSFDTAAMAECLADPNVQVLEHESSSLYYLVMNCDSAAFSNKLVRQAVAFAFEREDCLVVGYEGYGTVCENAFAPAIEGYTENPSGYKYDAEKAKSLLAQAGVTTLDVKAAVKSDAEERIIQVIQAYLGQIGINLTYSRVDNTVMAEVMGNNEYDMCIMNSSHYKDPELFYGRYLGAVGIGANNYAHYDSAEANAAIAKAATTDMAARKAAFVELNKIVCDDAPWIGMFTSNLYCLARAGVKGVNMNLETTYWYHTICY